MPLFLVLLFRNIEKFKFLQFRFRFHKMNEIPILIVCRCKICHKVILFESDTIQRHLSKSHKTNLGLYRLEYLNRMQQQQQSLQMTTN
jgi:hypothetical protein